MKLELDDPEFAELVAEKLALRLEHTLAERIANAVIARFECLKPGEAALFLDVTTRTLGENHVDWGLDKSVALGQTNPRYFLSQVIEALRAKVIKGRVKASDSPVGAALERRAA